MKSKVTFNKSGSGSFSGRVTIPVAYLEMAGISRDDREVEISFKEGKITIEKIEKEVKITELNNVTYKAMEAFILANVEYTYNVDKCLSGFISDMGEKGAEEDVFYMTDDQEHFKISVEYEIENEDTDEEKIVYKYNVKKL